MPVEIRMRDSLDSVVVKGGFEKVVTDMNLQMSQGKKLVILQQMDDLPIAISTENVNTIKAQSLEDAFFPRPDGS